MAFFPGSFPNRATSPIHAKNVASFTRAQTVSAPSGMFLTGEVSAPLEFHKQPKGKTFVLRPVTQDFYFRIYVFPLELDILSPALNIDYSYSVWNAFPYPNLVQDILGTGADQLSLSLKEQDTFRTLENREVNVRILSNKEPEITASWKVTFEHGVATFHFKTVFSLEDLLFPDGTILENWEWKTSVFTSVSGPEQRLALRTVPRRNFQLEYDSADIDKYREYVRFINDTVGKANTVPLPCYSSFLTKNLTSGDTEIFFSHDNTDIRAGESAWLMPASVLSAGIRVGITSVSSTGAVLKSPVLNTELIGRELEIIPIKTVQFDSSMSLKLDGIQALLSGSAQNVNPDAEFVPDFFVSPVDFYDELPVLKYIPLKEQGVTWRYSALQETTDNGISAPVFQRRGEFPFESTSVRFCIQRYDDPESLAWWRHFLYYLRGQQKVFICPSWKEDFILSEQVDPGVSKVLLKGTYFLDAYTGRKGNIFMWFVDSENKFFVRKILQFEKEGPNTAIFTDRSFIPYPVIRTAGICDLARLNSDLVELEHQDRYTYLTMRIRTVDE